MPRRGLRNNLEINFTKIYGLLWRDLKQLLIFFFFK